MTNEKTAASKARKKEYDKAYYAKRREYFYEKHKRWGLENKDHVRAYAREFYSKNAASIRGRAWPARFKAKYGITIAERDALFAAQGERCAACAGAIASHSRGWHTDHCHRMGVVRGILCHACNTSLGQMKEDASAIRALADYIERHQ